MIAQANGTASTSRLKQLTRDRHCRRYQRLARLPGGRRTGATKPAPALDIIDRRGGATDWFQQRRLDRGRCFARGPSQVTVKLLELCPCCRCHLGLRWRSIAAARRSSRVSSAEKFHRLLDQRDRQRNVVDEHAAGEKSDEIFEARAFAQLHEGGRRDGLVP